jgi:hypothetical protein
MLNEMNKVGEHGKNTKYKAKNRKSMESDPIDFPLAYFPV